MIIKFDPNTIDNMPKFLNDSIESNKSENYIMFIFNDIYEDINNVDDFYKKYENLMKRFDLPFSFYPYYNHFNKVLWRSASYGVPKMKVSINGKPAADVVNQVSYGMFMLDIKKLLSLNFKFSENFKLCFYIQEYIDTCFKNKLYFSTNSFLDVYNSFDLIKSNLKDGYFIDNKQFAEEKTKFYSKYPSEKENIQEFIKNLKDKCQKIKLDELNASNSEIITVSSTLAREIK